jgi:hypothetical protein
MKCAKCRSEIAEAANSVRVKLYGGSAAFHFTCFGSFLRDGAGDELEQRAWRESTTAAPAAPAAARARGEKYKDKSE